MAAKESLPKRAGTVRRDKSKKQPGNLSASMDPVESDVLISPNRNVWSDFMSNPDYVQWVAPVNLFKHAPFSTSWKDYAKLGMMVEIQNPMTRSKNNYVAYWVATIRLFAGYRALLEFVNVNEAPPVFMWIPFCSVVPKSFGYSFRNKELLFPVTEKDATDTKFFDKLLEKLDFETIDTIPRNHVEVAVTEVQATGRRFSLNEIVEAMDKSDCSVTRLARITAILGDRIHVMYVGEEDKDREEGFWFASESPEIHKVGWCGSIGCELLGFGRDPVFPPLHYPEVLKLPRGMKLEDVMLFEMRHPLFPYKIVPAYVIEVYERGYFLAGTDWTREYELVEMVMHVSSDFVLPLNFCRDNKIEFDAPLDRNYSDVPAEKRGTNGQPLFSWREYLVMNCYKKLDLSSIPKEPSKIPRGSKLEATKVCDPTYMGPATVVKVAAHLIKIHFDGYSRSDQESYQWMSSSSSDIYPAGYAEMIGHKIHGKPEPPNDIDIKDPLKTKFKFVHRSQRTTATSTK